MIIDNVIYSFCEERDAALISLDKETIQAFTKKWDCEFPYRDESIFWAGVHKARLEIVSFPELEKEKSRKWLRDNGFKAYGGIPV